MSLCRMFTFRRGANNPKKSPATQASGEGEGGNEGDRSKAGNISTPVEPPTPSPLRPDPNALPLIVENAPTPVLTGKEVCVLRFHAQAPGYPIYNNVLMLAEDLTS